MIQQETITIDGIELNRTYSDANKKIRKIGTEEVYSEAIDVIPCIYEYEETDVDIDVPAPTEDEMKEALTILGVTV